ncbi:MAG TPA: SurA N-terminal domain-containing protein [Kofleriaceae bacterium]
MLEDARKKGASVFVYLIFCLLIVIFVINFGPQGGQGGGCGDSGNVVVSVDGKEASQSSYKIAYSNPYNRGTGNQHKYVALETIIRRELLAQEAERRGLRATDDMVMDEIKKGRFFLGGQAVQIPGIFDENGYWSQNAFRGWVGQLNVSKNSYISEQQRGLLASMMQRILLDSVVVSRDEAYKHYLFENDTVQYDVVAFRPENYRAAMKLTDADVQRFLSTHGAEVQARYDADKRTYLAVKPQLQLRQIFIAKLEEPKPEPPPAPPPGQGSAAGSAAPAAGSAAGSAAPAAGSAAGSAAAPAAGSGAGSGSAVAKKDAPKAEAPPKADAPKAGAPKKDEKKVGMKIEEAKAKLEAVRTAAEKDPKKFIDAAKTLNTDDAMKASGGELGWRSIETPSLGEKAVSDAVKTLEPGKLSPVITTDRGAYLILAEAKREGDLTFDQVKHELAKELARDVWGKEAAKRAALSALDKARGGVGMNLEQLYEKEQAPANPGIDIQQIINDPNISPEQKQQILEMLMKQNQQGSLVWESKDIPAAWKADQADGAGGSATATKPAPAAGSAAKPAPAAGSAAAKPAPATGSAAKPAPATGSAAKPAPAAGSAAKPAPAAGSAAKPAPPTGTPGPVEIMGSAAIPAAGSAAPAAGSAAPAAGSAAPGAGAGSAAPPPAAPPAAPVEVVASTDKLPELGEIQKPTVARFGPTPRTPTMSGVGSSKEAATALFDELTVGMLAKKVYEGDGAFVVVQLVARSEPDNAAFEKEADRMIEELRGERAAAFVEDWMRERCEKLVKDTKIKPNPGLVRETDDNGNVVQSGYRPCMSFQASGGGGPQ